MLNIDSQTVRTVAEAIGAVAVAVNGYFTFRNTQLNKQNGMKIDEVHKLANGTTTTLTDIIKTEQAKNATLASVVAPLIKGDSHGVGSTDTVQR